MTISSWCFSVCCHRIISTYAHTHTRTHIHAHKHTHTHTHTHTYAQAHRLMNIHDCRYWRNFTLETTGVCFWQTALLIAPNIYRRTGHFPLVRNDGSGLQFDLDISSPGKRVWKTRPFFFLSFHFFFLFSVFLFSFHFFFYIEASIETSGEFISGWRQ